MTINRAALLANTYQLPAPVQQAPAAQNPFVDEVGDPASGLQQIDGVTSEYFQKWAALKGFARDVQENMGIDVRFPDPSVPESDRLHRIYLKSLADLKAQGERLKTGQQMYMADRQRGAMINQDPNQMYYDEMNVGTDIVDAKLDPIVDEANTKLQGPHFGDAINEARVYHQRVKSMLEQRKNTDPKNAGYWQRQLDSLIEPVKAVREFDPTRSGYTRIQGMQIEAAGGYLKEVASAVNGTANGYKLSKTEQDEDGGAVYELNSFNKSAYGGGTISGIYHVPATGRTYAKITGKSADGKNYVSKDVDLSADDIMGFAKELAGSNPKYAAQGAYLDVYALENELYGPDNSVAANTPDLQRSDLEDYKKRRETELTGLENQKQQAAVKQIEDDINSLEYRGMFVDDDRKSYARPSGGVITVVARKSKTKDDSGKYPVVYEIENIKELIPGKDTKFYEAYKKLQKQSVLNFLLNNKVTTTTGTKNAPTSKAKDPLGGIINGDTPDALKRKELL